MKTKSLLALFLALSVSVNVIVFLSSFTPQSGECPEIPSYSNGIELSDSKAQDCAEAYRNSVPGNAITGGIISGNALKELFCAPGTNGIAYSLAIDPEKQIGGDDAVFVILTGIEVTMDSEGKIESTRRTGTKAYRTNNWCPPNCVNYK